MKPQVLCRIKLEWLGCTKTKALQGGVKLELEFGNACLEGFTWWKNCHFFFHEIDGCALDNCWVSWEKKDDMNILKTKCLALWVWFFWNAHHHITPCKTASNSTSKKQPCVYTMLRRKNKRFGLGGIGENSWGDCN